MIRRHAACAFSRNSKMAGAKSTELLSSPLTISRSFSSFGGGDSAAAVAKNQSLSGGGNCLAALASEWPHVDVVRYTHKNRIWTLNHVHYYSEAFAIGLVETGLQPGDVVLSWLPAHFSETMVLQFACAKAGMILYSLDPELATKDRVAAQDALSKALTLTKANVFVSQEAGSDVPYVTLAEQVIPELQIYDTACGMPFVTPRFPHLRFCLQTGFDQDDKWGWWRYQYFLSPSNNLDKFVKQDTLNDDTPLAGELVLDANGMPTQLGSVKTHAQVMEEKLWPTYASILEKEFHTVEGVGVIF